jgi:hypothetical protein
MVRDTYNSLRCVSARGRGRDLLTTVLLVSQVTLVLVYHYQREQQVI